MIKLIVVVVLHIIYEAYMQATTVVYADRDASHKKLTKE